jgi:hypothetical protein
MVNRHCPKLAMKYSGPYKILEKLGSVAYKLELPNDSKLHPVFHVSQLKQCTADYTLAFKPLLHPLPLDMYDLESELILERRLAKKGNAAITQVLVKWTQLPAQMGTWEDYQLLKTQFPDAASWGHAASSTGGIVTPRAREAVK